eukprot:4386855-Pyramimonas_sp.AAC.1
MPPSPPISIPINSPMGSPVRYNPPGRCACCGALGRTKRGCSCSGGRSHYCIHLQAQCGAHPAWPPAAAPMVPPE